MSWGVTSTNYLSHLLILPVVMLTIRCSLGRVLLRSVPCSPVDSTRDCVAVRQQAQKAVLTIDIPLSAVPGLGPHARVCTSWASNRLGLKMLSD